MRPAGLPELLAPAGCWQALQAAVANGADAVYFGVEAFNARLRAENFRREELPELMAWLHARGCRGYLTFNVLVFADELIEASELLLAARDAGVDALIVQDVGLCLLARELCPELELHASTQMTITSAAGVAEAARLGCARVVLARELGLRDLRRLQNQLQQRGLQMPLEVFVHGALCVSYSGQCLTSESLGQRSANRGECAQACRLPYQLLVDGEPRDLDDRRYLLSPRDLAAWELLPELAAIGIASLKIEGRLKDPSYVAAVTAAYRQGLEQLIPRIEADRLPMDPALRHRLELTFSRGLDTGWLEGTDHRRLVDGRWSKKRGPLIGRLETLEPGGWLLLRSEAALRCGDGLVFELSATAPLQAPQELGGRITAIEPRGDGLQAIRLGPASRDLQTLAPGAPCWWTSDPQLERTWRQRAGARVAPAPRGIVVRVSGACGTPLGLQVLAADGLDPRFCKGLRLESALNLQASRGSGLDGELLQRQLGRLGGTDWTLRGLELNLPPGLFLPLPELNRLRRALVEQLEGLVGSASPPNPAPVVHRSPAQVLEELLAPVAAATASRMSDAREPPPRLIVLVRSLEQLLALRGSPIAGVIAELEQPRQLREAVAIGRGCWPEGLWLAGPRITRPDEAWSLEPLKRSGADGFLVRNADQLEQLTPLAPCLGDFSLNAANPLSVRWYLERWGLRRITASYDLALPQLLSLLAASPAGSLEVTLHQHMPLFHMEHCLFCALLSSGHDHTDCGRPCEQHRLSLLDRSGVEHPLRADLGCRNTLFNGRPQTGVEALPQLRRAGVAAVRLELLEESAEQAIRRVAQYRAVLDGELAAGDLWRREQIENRLGVTRGSLLERPGRQPLQPGERRPV